MASERNEDVGLEEVCYGFLFLSSCRPPADMYQRLKSALWLSIGKIVDEETIKLGVNATPQFIGALTEMVWAQIGTCTLILISLISLLFGEKRLHQRAFMRQSD